LFGIFEISETAYDNNRHIHSRMPQAANQLQPAHLLLLDIGYDDAGAAGLEQQKVILGAVHFTYNLEFLPYMFPVCSTICLIPSLTISSSSIMTVLITHLTLPLIRKPNLK
jgi:hypothetical protein